MVTARELAEVLGVHPNWVYAQAASGAMPSYKVGSVRRFLPAEVEAWLSERHTGGSPQPEQRPQRSPRPGFRSTRRRDR